MDMSRFNLALTRSPHGTATIVPRRTNSETDDDIGSPTYATLGLIKRATELYQEAAKNLRLA